MKKKRLDQIHKKAVSKPGGKGVTMILPSQVGSEIFTGYTTSAHSTNRSTKHSNQPSFIRGPNGDNKTSMMISFVNDLNKNDNLLTEHLRLKAL